MAYVTYMYSFSCGIRGYHEYKSRRVPELHKVLPVKHESGNSHDMYNVHVCYCHLEAVTRTLVTSVVGHLPREISRLAYFIFVRGASIMQTMDVPVK